MCDGIYLGELVGIHIKAVRAIPGFASSQAVIVVESNMSGKPMTIMEGIADMRLPNVIMMREDRVTTNSEDIRPGSRTTAQNKPAMIEMLKERMQQRDLLVHARFVVPSRQVCQYDDPFREVVSQLRSFMRIAHPNLRDPDKRTVISYSGKAGGGKDDLVMSLADNLFHHGIFVTSERYRAYAK